MLPGRHVAGPACRRAAMSPGRHVAGLACRRARTSPGRDVAGLTCRRAGMSRGRHVAGPACRRATSRRAGMSPGRHVAGPPCRRAAMSPGRHGTGPGPACWQAGKSPGRHVAGPTSARRRLAGQALRRLSHGSSAPAGRQQRHNSIAATASCAGDSLGGPEPPRCRGNEPGRLVSAESRPSLAGPPGQAPAGRGPHSRLPPSRLGGRLSRRPLSLATRTGDGRSPSESAQPRKGPGA